MKKTGEFYVYILECADKTYYTGYTNDLEKRVERHNAGYASKYTRARLPVKLVWFKEYKRFKKAFLEELRVKKLRKVQKDKLIDEFVKRKLIGQPKVLIKTL